MSSGGVMHVGVVDEVEREIKAGQSGAGAGGTPQVEPLVDKPEVWHHQ
jgi:hypothetical protein